MERCLIVGGGREGWRGYRMREKRLRIFPARPEPDVWIDYVNVYLREWRYALRGGCELWKLVWSGEEGNHLVFQQLHF